MQIIVTSRGQTYRGTLAPRVTLNRAPRPVADEIARQASEGQDRGQVEHADQLFTWHAAAVFELREWADGTWYVLDVVENTKTHDGYFATRREAEAELAAIFADAEPGSAAEALVA